MSAGGVDAVRAAVVALVSLPRLGPARYAALVGHAGDPIAAWELVRSGVPDHLDLRCTTTRAELVGGWRREARTTDPAEVLDRHRRAGIEVLLPSDPSWPDALVADPEPPPVLFVQGAAELLEVRGVAVVGTRRCTAAGAQVARRLGAGLADAGVTVVSGLALGIDGAAHRGALDAGGSPLAIVGSGLDHVYPPRNRDLWERVAAEGAVVSEAPLGTGPERWRFPARNRLIAALSCAVVVVESRERGGSMSTVEEALRRQVEVLAVPGPVLTEHSAGTNRLLTEGAGLVRDATDVLAAVGTALPVAPGRAPSGSDRAVPGSRADPDDDGPTGAVVAVLSPAPATVEQVAVAAQVDVGQAITALARLEAAGRARRVPGGYEAVWVP